MDVFDASDVPVDQLCELSSTLVIGLQTDVMNSIANGKNQFEWVETQDVIKDDIYDVMIQRCKQKYSTDVSFTAFNISSR